mgnify:CR=1 FL=1
MITSFLIITFVELVLEPSAFFPLDQLFLWATLHRVAYMIWRSFAKVRKMQLQDNPLRPATFFRVVSEMAVLFLQKTFHLAHFLPSPWSKKGKLKLDARVLYIFFPFFFFQKLQWWDYGFHRGPLRSKQQNEGFSHHIWGPLRWAKAAEPANRSDWWQQYVFKTETRYFFFPCPNLIYTDINNLLGSSTPLSCAKPATSACV